jgi:pyridine nucleotide-disulfide oxidoreductase
VRRPATLAGTSTGTDRSPWSQARAPKSGAPGSPGTWHGVPVFGRLSPSCGLELVHGNHERLPLLAREGHHYFAARGLDAFSDQSATDGRELKTSHRRASCRCVPGHSCPERSTHGRMHDRLTCDAAGHVHDPSIASVGLTEQAARDAGHPVMTSILPLKSVPRVLVNRDTTGAVNLVADESTGGSSELTYWPKEQVTSSKPPS